MKTFLLDKFKMKDSQVEFPACDHFLPADHPSDPVVRQGRKSYLCLVEEIGHDYSLHILRPYRMGDFQGWEDEQENRYPHHEGSDVVVVGWCEDQGAGTIMGNLKGGLWETELFPEERCTHLLYGVREVWTTRTMWLVLSQDPSHPSHAEVTLATPYKEIFPEDHIRAHRLVDSFALGWRAGLSDYVAHKDHDLSGDVATAFAWTPFRQ